jgi:hypothetical protein
MYILVADDDHAPYTSTYEWTPQLHPYQQKGANVLFFTFLNPRLMPDVPPAFAALAKTRGTDAPGAVPKGTFIIFAIGGDVYSRGSWLWLASRSAAEAMAAKVAEWPSKYGCDGIDLDIEGGAGQVPGAGENLIYFVAKLKQLAPQMVITQPVFGGPAQIPAPNRLLEASYNKSLASPALGSVSKVGIMVYSGTDAENYLEYYTNGRNRCTQWYCPIDVCVPASAMVLGLQGTASASTIKKVASDVVAKGLGGIMVWDGTVIDSSTNDTAVQYSIMYDASRDKLDAWAEALGMLQGAERAPVLSV